MALYATHIGEAIALCSDIGPLLLPMSGGGMSDRSEAYGAMLKSRYRKGWSNFIDYRFRGFSGITESATTKIAT
jgi:hypothetical protein